MSWQRPEMQLKEQTRQHQDRSILKATKLPLPKSMLQKEVFKVVRHRPWPSVSFESWSQSQYGPLVLFSMSLAWSPGPGSSQSCQCKLTFTHLAQPQRTELLTKPVVSSLSSPPVSKLCFSPFAKYPVLGVVAPKLLHLPFSKFYLKPFTVSVLLYSMLSDLHSSSQ